MNTFDEEIRELFARTSPVPCPVDTKAIVTVKRPHRVSLRRRNENEGKLPLWVWLGGASAAALLLAALGTIRLAEQPTFAQTQAQVEQVRTIDYVQVTEYLDVLPGADTGLLRPGETPRSMLAKIISDLEKKHEKGNATEREECGWRLASLRPYAEDPEANLPAEIRRVRIKGKHRQRTDFVYPVHDCHSVQDARNGMDVSFYHGQKKKSIIKHQKLLDAKSGEWKTEPSKLDPAVDFYRKVRAVPADARQLGKKTMDGRQVVGFEAATESPHGVWTYTYWVDSQTHLPVRRITEFRGNKPTHGSVRWTLSQFVYDIPLDDSLFDTSIPEGYQEEDGTILGLEVD